MKSYKELDDELRVLRSKYKANPSEKLKEQIYLLDKKLKDIDKSQAIYYRPIGNYIPNLMKLKTNVSIKFNSIEEYREIESKLIELGCKSAKSWNNAVIQIHKKGFINIEDKLFYLDSTQIYRTLYNTLQEFLKDENSNL